MNVYLKTLLKACSVFVGLAVFSVSSFAQKDILIAQELEIESGIFSATRTIRVSLPQSYSANSTQQYPVIYVARGQLEHLVTLASIDLLSDEVPEFIVVGVDGVGGDFLPNKDGSQTDYSRFLHEEVVAMVHDKYRAANFSIILGHSEAGRFVANEWLERGGEFNQYISISPSLDDNHINTQSKALKTSSLKPKSNILITLASETNPRMVEPFAELQTIFADATNVSFASFPEQTHMSVRANAIMHGLRDTFSDWKPARELEKGALAPVLKHYDGLTKRFGFEVLPPLDSLRRMAGFHAWKENAVRNQYSKEIVAYLIKRDSREVDELLGIATQLHDYGSAGGKQRVVSYICANVSDHAACQ